MLKSIKNAQMMMNNAHTMKSNDAIVAMTHMLNYVDASSYDAQMTLQHKECRHNMDQVYDQCCKTQTITHADCRCFYANLKAMEPVISTDDDPEYTVLHNELIKCFRDVKRGEAIR